MKCPWTKILTYVILVAAYAVVIYELIIYDNYSELFLQLKLHSSVNWPYITLTLVLVPVNLIIESYKWKYAISPIEKVTLKHALYATLIGQVGAIATPNKLGDYPTRSLTLSKGNKANATIMGFISAWTLPLVIIIIGIFSSLLYINYYDSEQINTKYLIAICICCIIIIITLFSIPKISKKITRHNSLTRKLQDILEMLSNMSAKRLINIILLSLLRYTVFCVQLYLTLRFFDIKITVTQAIISIPTIYLLTTITPSVIASEVATRSSYAILILSHFCPTTPTIAIATTILWCLNNGLPLTIGFIIFKPKRVKFKR